MTEKINGPGFRPTTDTGRTGNTRRPDTSGTENGAAGAGRGSPAAPGDTVRLTDSSLLLNRLEEAVSAAPEADAQRIETIKQAIAAGTYEVKPAAIAEKMIGIEKAISNDGT